MSFTPRTLANGRICCSNKTALCDTCKAHQKENTMAHETEGAPLSANASFKERYAAEQTRMFANLRTASRKIEVEAATRPPEIRTLETLAEVPDPYAPARMRAAEQAEAIDDVLNDPKYHEPYGRPVSGYDLALAARQVEKDIARGDR